MGHTSRAQVPTGQAGPKCLYSMIRLLDLAVNRAAYRLNCWNPLSMPSPSHSKTDTSLSPTDTTNPGYIALLADPLLSWQTR